MAELNEWNVDPSSAPNTSASPDGAPEGTTTFGQLNNIIREHMAVMARWYADTSTGITTAGTAPTYTVASNRTLSAYAAGLTFRIKIHAVASTTAQVTINVSSLGAKNLYDMHGNAILAAQLVANEYMDIVYDGSQFRKVSGSAARFGPGHMHEVDASAATRTLLSTDHGKCLSYVAGTPTYTAPSTLPDGFECIISCFTSTTIQAGSGADIAWSDGTSGSKTLSGGEHVILVKIGTVLGSQRYLGILTT